MPYDGAVVIAQDQSGAIALLAGDAGGMGPTEATIVTHISRIFLKRDRALKLKQAVRFPYVDYSTPELRLTACQAELDLNRRTAPGLYIAVRRITRSNGGRLAFDGDGELVDAVVEMRRFADDSLFDGIAVRNSLTPAHMTALAREIAAFHDAAPTSFHFGGYDGMADVLDINERSLGAADLVSSDEATAFAKAFRQRLDDRRALLDSRRAAGKVRRCHGDLILRNICLFEGKPTLFDCIEFSEPLATIDVLYDLAFLLMDLWHRGQRQLANFLFNRYLDARDETDGLDLVPFFMAVRAAVRAHVTAAQAMALHGHAALAARREALAYFSLAKALLQPAGARLFAFGGFSGSGKSTLAAQLAPQIGPPPGARVLSSDRIRKQLHGVAAEERLASPAYRPEVSRQVYDLMFREAERALQAGASVVMDAVFDLSDHRGAAEELARKAGLPFNGFWLDAPRHVLAARIAGRKDDPSDATSAVLDAQLGRGAGDVRWTRIDAQRDVAAVAAQVLTGAPVAPGI